MMEEKQTGDKIRTENEAGVIGRENKAGVIGRENETDSFRTDIKTDKKRADRDSVIRRIINWSAGILLSLALLLIIFITSFQVSMYGDMDWYRRTFERYDVLSQVDMTMDDLMFVTYEMMEYLINNREELVVYTTIGGEYKDFFGAQERFHMWEVQVLFLGGLELRYNAIIVLLAGILVLLLTKADLKRVLPKSFWIALGATTGIGTTLALIFYFNFSRAFVIFHEIFFDNDYWIFNPRYSYMIRVLPERLFYDMIMRVLGVFGISILILLVASILLNKHWNKEKNLIK
jgi:integral membrane protein (TIGR01906 family)